MQWQSDALEGMERYNQEVLWRLATYCQLSSPPDTRRTNHPHPSRKDQYLKTQPLTSCHQNPGIVTIKRTGESSKDGSLKRKKQHILDESCLLPYSTLGFIIAQYLNRHIYVSTCTYVCLHIYMDIHIFVYKYIWIYMCVLHGTTEPTQQAQLPPLQSQML